MEHFKGCEIAYKHYAETIVDEERQKSEKAREKEYAALYEEFIRENGHDRCVFIPRRGMEELSLLTEIVKGDITHLFRPLRLKTIKDRKSRIIQELPFAVGGGAWRVGRRATLIPRSHQ